VRFAFFQKEAKRGRFAYKLQSGTLRSLPFRIVPNVGVKLCEMLCTADDVIEALPVPNASVRSHDATELMRGKGFPGVKYLAQLMFGDRSHDSVYMIRHHHKLAEVISHAIKVQKGGFHNSVASWACKNALTITGIEPAIYGLHEAFVIFLFLAISVRFRV